VSKTDSRVSENYCKKLARTRQLNETMKTGLFMIEAKKNRLHIHHLRQAYTGLNQLLPPPYDIHTHLQSRFRIANYSTTVLHGGRSI